MDPGRRWCAVVTLFFILGACSSSSKEVGTVGAPSACKFRGNQVGAETCMTTMSVLLSQPEKFDGRLVSFHAWIDHINGAILLFPSRDELDARDSFSSLVAYPESSPGAFQEIPSVEGGGGGIHASDRHVSLESRWCSQSPECSSGCRSNGCNGRRSFGFVATESSELVAGAW